jgi:hypothetical protein
VSPGGVRGIAVYPDDVAIHPGTHLDDSCGSRVDGPTSDEHAWQAEYGTHDTGASGLSSLPSGHCLNIWQTEIIEWPPLNFIYSSLTVHIDRGKERAGAPPVGELEPVGVAMLHLDPLLAVGWIKGTQRDVFSIRRGREPGSQSEGVVKRAG